MNRCDYSSDILKRHPWVTFIALVVAEAVKAQQVHSQSLQSARQAVARFSNGTYMRPYAEKLNHHSGSF